MEKLYIIGVPGKLGGARTKLRHLIILLKPVFDITVALPHVGYTKERDVMEFFKRYDVKVCLLKKLPPRLEGLALAVCELHFFSGGMAREVKKRGLKLIWSNEMMWEFKGEREAVKEGLVDRVLYVSEFQREKFKDIYADVPGSITGNYVDPDDFPYRERRNPTFTIGRLSRPDPVKYPEDFPVFYEELGLDDVRYRVMAWDNALKRKYAWHRFGPEWEFLAPQKERADKFLYSLDLFVYPLGHRVKESWGRSTVEAMLTGCIPLTPTGHQFHKLMVHEESGFICDTFNDFASYVQELHDNCALRNRIGRQSAEYARERICNRDEHRDVWVEALTA